MLQGVSCKKTKPVFKDLAKSNKNIKFVHVDVDNARETMANELVHISTLPTFQIYKDGKMIQTFSEANPTKLKNAIGLFDQHSEKKDVNEATGSGNKKQVKNNGKQRKEDRKLAETEESKDNEALNENDSAKITPESDM